MRVVYRRGSGPAVIVISEIPGITPDVAGFAWVFSNLRAVEPVAARMTAEEAAQIKAVLRAPVAMQHKPIDPERRKELADMLRGAVRSKSE